MTQIHGSFQYPYVYRYENKKYIDEFFNSGKIMLSAFAAYKSYTDNQLGDPEEGKSKLLYETVDMPLVKSFVQGHIEAGLNNYCFCTSTLLHPNLMATFSRDSVFRIIDVQGFAIEIATAIPNFTGQVYVGLCDYLYERLLKERAGMFSVVFEPDDKSTGPIQLFSIDAFGSRILFVKLIKYQSQSEFRFLWGTVINLSEANKIHL